MVTKTKKRKSTGTKKRFIGKPSGQIQERVQAAGPEHFGIIAVDCAKRRSKWMLCNFYGKVLIEPTSVEHDSGNLQLMRSETAGRLARKKRRGVQRIGGLLMPLLIRLGVGTEEEGQNVESNTSEARSSD